VEEIMIEINNVQGLEELAEGIRKIKVKVPDKKTALDEELLFMRVQGASYVPGDIIENNDIAALKVCGGTKARYNKDSVEIAVGRNLYNKDVEAALIGMKARESKTMTVDGEEITVTVLAVKKKAYSEITLEKVKAEDPTVTSVEAYKDSIYQGICDKLISDKADKLQIKPMVNKLIKAVDIKFNYDEADNDVITNCNMQAENINNGLKDDKQHDQVVEYMRSALVSGDYAEPYLKDGETKEEYINSLNDEALKKLFDEGTVIDIRNIYIKVAFCEKNGVDLSEEAYERELDENSKRYNVPVETYKQQYPYCAFKYFNIERKLNKLLLGYLKKGLIEVVVK
jgi:hypothetical protein